jgi:pimeloyl-ACP methyl ester carboxylesterase
MSHGERLLTANGVPLCVETFGTPADPTILLIHGASASMLWWEEQLCTRIAAGGRHVVRFDNRDTGRSISYPAGRPGYGLTDMVDDALGVLDALGIERAHVVGRSMAGTIAARAALRRPDRVASLTLVSTSPGGTGLPPMADAFLDYVGAGDPDPADPATVIPFVTGLMRVYSGGSPYFDERATRALVERDVARTNDVGACLTNHFVIDTGHPDPRMLTAIEAPTLVVHGERDPVFPLAHGEVLRDRIHGARLLTLPEAGHELPAPLWDRFVPALLDHTAGARTAGRGWRSTPLTPLRR